MGQVGGGLARRQRNNNGWQEKESKDYMRKKESPAFRDSLCVCSHRVETSSTSPVNNRSSAANQAAHFLLRQVRVDELCVRRSPVSWQSIIHHHIYSPVSQLIQINGANRKHERKLQSQKINQSPARRFRGGELIITPLTVHGALLSYHAI